MTAPPEDLGAYVENIVAARRVIGSTGFEQDESWVREMARRAFERGLNPAGTQRQLVASICSGDRTPRLAAIVAPTVVLHGTEDPLIDPSGGVATAEAIPGAELVLIEGWGHDLPPGVWPRLVDAIDANARRADGGVRPSRVHRARRGAQERAGVRAAADAGDRRRDRRRPGARRRDRALASGRRLPRSDRRRVRASAASGSSAAAGSGSRRSRASASRSRYGPSAAASGASPPSGGRASRGATARVEAVAVLGLARCRDAAAGALPAGVRRDLRRERGRAPVNVRVRHPAPPEGAAASEWRFRADDVDVAGHVNNSHYWAPLEEEWRGTEVDGFDGEIEYRDPAQPGSATVLSPRARCAGSPTRSGAVNASIELG